MTAEFRMKRMLSLLVLMTFSFHSLVLRAQDDRAQVDLDALQQEAIQAAVTHVKKSVVRIETIGGTQTDDRVRISTGPTTGMIVDENGFIISSAFNFLQNPTSILVSLPNGKRAAAKIVARDESRKLVLLKVESSKLPVPAFADLDEMQVGQTTIAIGKTISSDGPNVSIGILSAKDRVWGRAIQTDAKISPLNYGGPLVDLHGRAMGILVPMSPQGDDEVAGAEWYDSGIGFAVPMQHIAKNLAAMKKGETIRRGLLGISLKGDNVQVDRAILSNTMPTSPAAKAGLKAGDEIVEINSLSITNQAELKHALGNMNAGESIRVKVKRKIDDKEDKFEKLAKEIELAAEVLPYDQPFLGLLPARPAKKAKDKKTETGIEIRYVFPDSCIAKAGIEAGDRLLSFDGHKINDRSELHEKMQAKQAGDKVAIKWSRGGKETDATVALNPVSIEVPDLNPARLLKPPARDKQLKTGTFPLKIVAEDNRAIVIVPEKMNEFSSVGLVVHFQSPGKLDEQKLEATWKDVCGDRGLILLAIEPLDPKSWSPTEVAFVRKAVEELLNGYAVDRNRVVVHGTDVGGSFAALTAFAHRDLIRSVISINGSVPARMNPPVVQPNDPLSIYWSISDEKLAERSATIVEALQQRKFPIKFVSGKLSKELQPEILDWIETLDRI